jgi:hypothetical protein
VSDPLIVVVDGRHCNGVEGSLLYTPTKQIECSFVEALEMAQPCAAVWWDRELRQIDGDLSLYVDLWR